MRRAILVLGALLPVAAAAQAPSTPTSMPLPRPPATLSDRVTERVVARLGALELENISLAARVQELQEQIEAMRRREVEKKPADAPK